MPLSNIPLLFLLAFSAGVAAQPAQPAPLDAATRQAVVEGVAREVEAGYLDAHAGAEMAHRVRARAAASTYDRITDPVVLVDSLERVLQSVRVDRHLRVRYSPDPLPDYDADPTPEEDAAFGVESRRDNYGFRRAEVLAGNVGYLDLGTIYPIDSASVAAADAAAAFLAGTDALVLDLRSSRGGMSTHEALLGHLLGGGVHLSTLAWRVQDRRPRAADSTWSRAPARGSLLQTQPLYVLVSPTTFSAAESVAYVLQTRGRAVVVGERTRGGANPGGRVRVSDHVYVWIPQGATVSPVTQSNWEGVGVTPDVQVPSDSALAAAHRLALRSLREAASPERRDEIDAVIAALDASEGG